jgi:hypothetical protein
LEVVAMAAKHTRKGRYLRSAAKHARKVEMLARRDDWYRILYALEVRSTARKQAA